MTRAARAAGPVWFPCTPTRPEPLDPTVPATDEAVALAVVAADAADDRKATDVTILEVADILGLVDLFLLATAGSDRQVRAVADRIEERLEEEADRRVLRREGVPASGWVLLDYGDLVCHVLSPEQRAFYDLERLWGDVPRRDPVSGELRPAPTGGRAVRQEVDEDLHAADVLAADEDEDGDGDRGVGEAGEREA